MIDLTHIHVGWPQGIVLSMYAIRILVHAVNNGEPLKGKFNFPLALTVTVVTLVLLDLGGFFNGAAK